MPKILRAIPATTWIGWLCLSLAMLWASSSSSQWDGQPVEAHETLAMHAHRHTGSIYEDPEAAEQQHVCTGACEQLPPGPSSVALDAVAATVAMTSDSLTVQFSNDDMPVSIATRPVTPPPKASL